MSTRIPPVKPPRWILPGPAPDYAWQVPGLSPVLQEILKRRGFASEGEVTAFLAKPFAGILDPFLLKGMARAVDRLLEAISRKEKVLIYGDYDVDGVTATVLLGRLLDFTGTPFQYTIPHRILDGYGLNRQALEEAHGDGCRLVITVDTGIAAHAELDHARTLGLDVIVTDHHQPKATLPEACAILNPNQHDCTYPNKHLAGVGVAFKLAHGTLQKCGLPADASKAFLKQCLTLVALGTIADHAGQSRENRCLVDQGLRLMKTSVFPGVQLLAEGAALQGGPVSAEQVSFWMAPKLNASGRMDHAHAAVQLLLKNDTRACRRLLNQLEAFNEERKILERRDTALAIAKTEASRQGREAGIHVVWDPSFHAGINGIVASRLVTHYGKPALVLAPDPEGYYRGSARAPDGANLLPFLEACSHLLIRFGGHPQAAGMTLAAENLTLLEETLQQATSLTPKDESGPCLAIDAVVDLQDVNASLVDGLQRMAPFGPGNPEPLFCTRRLTIRGEARVLKEQHLKLAFTCGGRVLEAIGFGLAASFQSMAGAFDSLDIVYRVRENYWQGQTRLQLQLESLRPAGGES